MPLPLGLTFVGHQLQSDDASFIVSRKVRLMTIQVTYNMPEEEPVADSIGTPFEIVGFRTARFENDDEDSSKIDDCIDTPAAREVLERLHDAVLQCRVK